MHRRHRRTHLPGHLVCPNQGVLVPAERARLVQDLVRATEQAASIYGRSPLLRQRLSEHQRQRLRGRWRADVPQLARQLAEVLDREPVLLAPLGLSGDELRAREAEARQLQGLKAVMDRLSELLGDALLESRGGLYSDAQRVLSAIEALTQTDLLSPEDRARLHVVAEPALALVERRNEKVRGKRRQLRALRGGAQEAGADRERPREPGPRLLPTGSGDPLP